MADTTTPTAASSARVMYDRRGRVYQPTVGPKLRIVLFTIFFLFAVLGANSVYLVSLKGLNWFTGQEHGNWFYLYMFLLHLVVGLVLIVPFVLFIALHLKTALGRPNRKAVRLGFGLLISSIVLLATGVLMVFQRQLFATTSLTGQIVYWLHALTPLAVIGFYLLHRMAGPRIQWGYMKIWGAAAALIVLGFGYMHFEDPRQWGVKGAGEDYFFPSSARTIGANNDGTPFIPAEVLMNDRYCLRCHSDTYAGWFHSAHHFSSFNNLAYRQSILDMRKALDAEARQIAYDQGMDLASEEFKKLRARKVQATRWCAGCHDPVPFFSGAFDDDRFFEELEINLPKDGSKWNDPSLKTQPTAHAGLTCVSCHAITHVNSLTGNADYTIQQPPEYPFQNSYNPLLQKVNEYLVKAKPDLHKRSMLKPFHRTAEFCQVCHKVALPPEVNSYKWTRGQNHYDSWHNSGASGFAARSFYHPAQAKKCAECHMPDLDSQDFGTRNGKLRNHLFLGANTALPALRMHLGEKTYLAPIGDEEDVIRRHQEFLRDKKMRVDLFALREKGEIDGALKVLADPLPELEPGQTYLLEVVVRNLGVGHEFTQGTADSNEVWLHLHSKGGSLLADSGGIDEHGYGDPWAHYLNAVILDRKGQRIDRRNAKDIFVPLFNHQIGPSTSQVVHYRLTVPENQTEPITIDLALKYRKFDRIYQDFFMDRRRVPLAGALAGGGATNPLGALGWARVGEAGGGPELPVIAIAEDRVVLNVRGGKSGEATQRNLPPLWQRWNDYGVGLLLQGDEGAEKGLLRQAEAAFQEVVKLKPPEYLADAHLNLARVYLKEGRLTDMAQALEAAKTAQPGYFKTAWLRAELNRQNGRLDEAIEDFRTVLETTVPEKGFDFGQDREIRRQLADTFFLKAQRLADGSPQQQNVLKLAAAEFEQVVKIDPEDRQSHYMLDKCYRLLGDAEKADYHLARYKIYQTDNNARDDALRIYRLTHPWADHAAQAVVIYDLKPKTAPASSSIAGEVKGPTRASGSE
jgi:hypothetical protein